MTLRQIELLTEDGGYVATVEVLPFPDRGMPRVVMWGVRTFVRASSAPLPRAEKPWPYIECFAAASLTPSPGLPRWEPPPPAPVPPVDRSARAVVGDAIAPGEADTTIGTGGQQAGYVVLTDVERSKGFIRPVRRTYVHQKCGVATTMGQAIAETYARDPAFYSGTFCVSCKTHFPVGAMGEFVWDDGTKVGT
jgi:hypothetical protein